MINRFSQVISYFFHPLLMPTIGVILLMYSNSYVSYIPVNAKKWLIILTSVGTLLLPALMLPMFLLQGKISNLQLDKTRERIFPLILTTVFYLLTYMLFIKIPVLKFVHAFIFACFLSVLFAAVISVRWKISTHMIGLGGMTGLVLMASFRLDINFLYALIGILIASGLTGSSRLYLKAHDLRQVYSGYIVGLVTMILCLVLYVH